MIFTGGVAVTMRRRAAVIGVVLLLVVAGAGCSRGTVTSTPDESDSLGTSLGGIHLGDSKERVLEILGKPDSQELRGDEAGYYGQAQYVWTYDKGIEVIIGKDSSTVLDIAAYASEFKTNLGVKVGDNATDVFDLYRANYEELRSPHGGDILVGWFVVEHGDFLIFSIDKDNRRQNNNITPDSTIEVIELADSAHFD